MIVWDNVGVMSVGKRQHLEAELAAARDRVREAEAAIAVLDRYPAEDPCRDGDVLTFRKRFSPGQRAFTYAALRSGGRWYLTGQTTKAFAWAELCEWLATGVPVTKVTLLVPGERLL